MPEGDTLRILADKINERFAGARVERSVMRDPRLAGRDLAGTTLVDADAYGKHLFVRFDDARSLHVHLEMDGTFAVGRRSSAPEWKRRIELWFESGPLIGESVPVLELIPTADENGAIGHLGPDLCRPAGPPDPAEIATRLAAGSDTPLSGALLDQRRVAGFGNVYANDVPFVAGVSPFQPVGAIEGLAALVATGTALIRANARLRRQNTTGRRLGTEARWVHGTGRRPCPVCGDRLRYADDRSTPWRRSITWCDTCQPPGNDASVEIASAKIASVDTDRIRRLLALHPAMRDPILPWRDEPPG